MSGIHEQRRTSRKIRETKRRSNREATRSRGTSRFARHTTILKRVVLQPSRKTRGIDRCPSSVGTEAYEREPVDGMGLNPTSCLVRSIRGAPSLRIRSSLESYTTTWFERAVRVCTSFLTGGRCIEDRTISTGEEHGTRGRLQPSQELEWRGLDAFD